MRDGFLNGPGSIGLSIANGPPPARLHLNLQAEGVEKLNDGAQRRIRCWRREESPDGGWTGPDSMSKICFRQAGTVSLGINALKHSPNGDDGALGPLVILAIGIGREHALAHLCPSASTSAIHAAYTHFQQERASYVTP